MTNEENNQEQTASNFDTVADDQPPTSPLPPPAYTPLPPSQDTPADVLAPQPHQQPIMESAPQGFSPTTPHILPQQSYQQPIMESAPPYSYPPVQPQPYQQPSMGGAPQGFHYAPGQQPYPQYMAAGDTTQGYAPIPPSYMPQAAPKKPNQGLKILLIALAIIVVLGASGGGVAVYLLTRPQPVISVTSNYKVGTLPAGSTSTTFHVVGQKFSGTEAITFLLDGVRVPGSQLAHSDKDGSVTTDLTVDENWSEGNHTITARDADGYMTKIGSKVTIVPQGQAHTPGPNGAPPNDVSGIVAASIKFNGQNDTQTQNLHITGGSDPQGGTVCGDGDNGKSTTHNDTANGIAISITLTQTCSGTYKAGLLTYTETVTSAKFTFTKDGITIVCPANAPFVNLHLEGKFTNATTISGSASTDQVVLNCDHNVGTQTNDAMTGTWTGTM